ncbi:S-layer protein, partial [Bacillus anthracis]|nr:S-layer protein [Bacillus anthracis]
MLLFLFDIDNHYQYDSCVKYIYIKGDVILIMIKKKYM